MMKANDVRIKLFKKLPKSGINVFIVDGESVRFHLFLDFEEGGHGYHYDFIPKDEIWLDNEILVKERKFILGREMFELSAIKNRELDYDTAHKEALKYERKLRRENGKNNENHK